MVYEVSFSEKALNDLTDILNYLESDWSESAAKKFISLLHEKIEFIKSNPFLYPSFRQKPTIRKCIVTKQITLYYRVNESEGEAEVITLFDTRQDPKKLAL